MCVCLPYLGSEQYIGRLLFWSFLAKNIRFVVMRCIKKGHEVNGLCRTTLRWHSRFRRTTGYYRELLRYIFLFYKFICLHAAVCIFLFGLVKLCTAALSYAIRSPFAYAVRLCSIVPLYVYYAAVINSVSQSFECFVH